MDEYTSPNIPPDVHFVLFIRHHILNDVDDETEA